MIDLTENTDLLERLIMTGPEISRVVEELTGANDNDDDEKLQFIMRMDVHLTGSYSSLPSSSRVNDIAAN